MTKVPSASADEQLILDDIYVKTGRKFARIAAIDIRQKEIAEAVLPVLRQWVPVVSESGLRATLYALFLTPFAAPYTDELLSWWLSETDLLARGWITQGLSKIASAQTAKRIWETYKKIGHDDFESWLLARLSCFRSVADEVVDRIHVWLDTEGRQIVRRSIELNHGIDPLRPLSRVKDPRVKQWFAEYLDSPNSQLRALAHASAGQSPSGPPKGFHFVSGPPDGNQEIISTEIDSDKFAAFLRDLWKSRDLKIMASIRPDKILEGLRQDAWAVSDLETSEGGMVTLWLRLEDHDAIEIWLTRSALASRVPS